MNRTSIVGAPSAGACDSYTSIGTAHREPFSTQSELTPVQPPRQASTSSLLGEQRRKYRDSTSTGLQHPCFLQVAQHAIDRLAAQRE